MRRYNPAEKGIISALKGRHGCLNNHGFLKLSNFTYPEEEKMKIGMIGMGFVGGTTAEIFSDAHDIFPYDKYKIKYEYKKKKEGFSELNGKKRLEELANESEIVFVCVDTPMKPSGEIDYSSVYNSMDTLKEYTKDKKDKLLVVIRSTAVSGTSDKLEENYPFNFAFNPEFLKERDALEDMLKTDRVVIGANRNEDYTKVENVYKPLFPNARYIHTDTKTAEMIKYAANVMLTIQIAGANEIYKICESSGINYDAVKETILLDERIGRNINVPGHDGDFGFGGKCFPKDLNALIYLAREQNYRPYLLEEVWRLNEKVRKNKDWLKIPGAVSENKNFS